MDRRPQGHRDWSVLWSRWSSTLRYLWMLCSPLQKKQSKACKDAVTATWLGYSDATYATEPILPTAAAAIWTRGVWTAVCTASANVYSRSEIRMSSCWIAVSSQPVDHLEFWDVCQYFIILRTVDTEQVLQSLMCLKRSLDNKI